MSIDEPLPKKGIARNAEKELTLLEKQYIYRILTREFPFDEEIPMAKFTKILVDNGIDKADYGYRKAKEFCKDLPEFVTMRETAIRGTPQYMVVLNKVDDWIASSDELPRITANGFAGRNAIYPPMSLELELEGSFSNFVAVSHQNQVALQTLIPDEVDVIAMLDREYAIAQSKGYLCLFDDKVLFPIHYCRSNGEPIIIAIRRLADGVKSATHSRDKTANEHGATAKRQWYLSYIDAFVAPDIPAASRRIGGDIDDFAAFNEQSWHDFLKSLAAMAYPEDWAFAGEDPDSLTILNNYIRFTFYRLQLEDKVSVSENREFAAFNTGLVTKEFEDIYAIFRCSSEASRKNEFEGFCTAGGRGLGKQLARYFFPLPQQALYYRKRNEVLFDIDKSMVVDYDHIILDGLHRIPLAILKDEFHGSPEALDLIGTIESSPSAEEAITAFRSLADVVREDRKLYNRLKSRFEFAIGLAKRQVKWDYRIAIPSYHPRSNSMSLLLPLCLQNESDADVALVVELLPSGAYQGQTILTLRQAFLNARLIYRVWTSWLRADRIEKDNGWHKKRSLSNIEGGSR